MKPSPWSRYALWGGLKEFNVTHAPDGSTMRLWSGHYRCDHIRDMWMHSWIGLLDPFQFTPARRH